MQLNAKVLSMLGSCGAYGMAACEIAEHHDNMACFTADLRNFSGLDRFAKMYPDRFYNLGIAEQNLVDVSAGFASEGNIAFASTYASFACTRCLDQVSLSMAYMKLNVKLVGLTSGFSVGILGPTHECITDLAIMQSLPNITILSPADGIETIKAIIASADIAGPVYIRLTGGMNNPIVYRIDYDYKIGNAITLKEGTDAVVIATGSMVANSLNAAEILEKQGIHVKVIDMHTIRPLDSNAIIEAAGYPLLATIEEHGLNGGLGSAVSQLLMQRNITANMVQIGVPCEFSSAASYQALLDKYGLTGEKIAERIYKELVKTI